MAVTAINTIPVRFSLTADAVICGALGALAVAAAVPIAAATNLPTDLIRIAGLLLIPCVAFIVVQAAGVLVLAALQHLGEAPDRPRGA